MQLDNCSEIISDLSSLDHIKHLSLNQCLNNFNMLENIVKYQWFLKLKRIEVTFFKKTTCDCKFDKRIDVVFETIFWTFIIIIIIQRM
jgi:hypothetical protein